MKGRSSAQLIAGIFILLLGITFLLDNLNIADVSSIFRFIPALFILLGIWQLLQNGFRAWIGPAILIFFATLFQLAALDILKWELIGQLIWPVMLILVGFSILFNRSGRSSEKYDDDASQTFNIVTLFSGHNRRITSSNFQNGDIVTMFGGAEIDLHQADVTDKPARINVFVMFGGVNIKASPDMLIEKEVFAIFGGSSDNRKQRKRLPDEKDDVILTGFVAFGGVGIEE